MQDLREFEPRNHVFQPTTEIFFPFQPCFHLFVNRSINILNYFSKNQYKITAERLTRSKSTKNFVPLRKLLERFREDDLTIKDKHKSSVIEKQSVLVRFSLFIMRRLSYIARRV